MILHVVFLSASYNTIVDCSTFEEEGKSEGAAIDISAPKSQLLPLERTFTFLQNDSDTLGIA